MHASAVWKDCRLLLAHYMAKLRRSWRFASTGCDSLLPPQADRRLDRSWINAKTESPHVTQHTVEDSIASLSMAPSPFISPVFVKPCSASTFRRKQPPQRDGTLSSTTWAMLSFEKQTSSTHCAKWKPPASDSIL